MGRSTYANTSATYSAAIVRKLWNDCDILRDDGHPYGADVKQLTGLLVLKVAREQT